MMDNQRSLKEKVEEIEAEEIIEALKKTGWVKARAARLLGITERMCGYKIKKYGISREVVEQKDRRIDFMEAGRNTTSNNKEERKG